MNEANHPRDIPLHRNEVTEAEAEALHLIQMLGQAGHLAADDKGKVSFHPDGQ